MYRIILIALAVMLAIVGPVAAQDTNPKSVYGLSAFWAGTTCEGRTFQLIYHASLQWRTPSQAPDSYRIRWGPRGRFTSWRKDNTDFRGNAFVDGSATRFSLPNMKVKCGQKAHIQIRARYNGEKNGAWSTVKLGSGES